MVGVLFLSFSKFVCSTLHPPCIVTYISCLLDDMAASPKYRVCWMTWQPLEVALTNVHGLNRNVYIHAIELSMCTGESSE